MKHAILQQHSLVLIPLSALLGCSSEPSDPSISSIEDRRSGELNALPDSDVWKRRVLYFTLLDRFSNGDTSIDHSNGQAVCNNPADPHAYQGGDLAGLRQKLDYIDDLGAEAIWV